MGVQGKFALRLTGADGVQPPGSGSFHTHDIDKDAQGVCGTPMSQRHLINSNKDASRTKAIEIFPYFSHNLAKKKDSNKADAILIASYYYETFRQEE